MNHQRNLLSIVTPVYNEEASIPIFYKAILDVADEMKEDVEFELIFVDDGSTDHTLMQIEELSVRDSRIKYLSFSRNFGKESALYAGLEHAAGSFVAVIDADMQDPPSLLPQMYAAVASHKYDCAATRRVTRSGEPKIRSFCARIFYKIVNKISKVEIVDGARDFRLMSRTMVDSVLKVKEYNRFSKGIFSWVGFRTFWIEYENVERAAGETKWSFWKLFLYAMDGIIAFSVKPLSFASVFGMLFCLIAFVMICIVIVKTLIWGDPVAGYPSMICVIFFIGGIQLFSIGILRQYISKTYLESKRRPIYLVKEDNYNHSNMGNASVKFHD